MNSKKYLTNNSGLRYASSLYYWLGPIGPKAEKGWAVFFGATFGSMGEIDSAKFVERTNACLDFVRKNCNGCRLIYRPHPDEHNEVKVLNLASFEIQRDRQSAEDFLWENRANVKYAFSACSSSSIAGFSMGLNAYSFFHYFADVFKGALKIFNGALFRNLPSKFFIENLNQPLLENKIELKEDACLTEDFRKILAENKSPIWFTISENRLMFYIQSIVNMISKIDPARKINLIISKHHRWRDADIAEARKKFNDVFIFPRMFYSIKPSRLLSAFKISRQIKKFPIEKGSILIGFAHHDFIENCFMSYNKDKTRISFMLEETWDLNFEPYKLGLDPYILKFNKAGFFYNNFFEPLLGLNRTIFKHYKGGITSFIRLQKPIASLYDKVYLIRNSPADF